MIDAEFLHRFRRDVTGPRDMIDTALEVLFDQLCAEERLRERDMLLRRAAELLPLPPGAAVGTKAKALRVEMVVAARVPPRDDDPELRLAVRAALQFGRKPLCVKQIGRILTDKPTTSMSTAKFESSE